MPRITGTLTQLATGLPIVNGADVANVAPEFSTLALLRAASLETRHVQANSKRWLWNGASTATDDGTEDATAVQKTGTATGRYLPSPVQGSTLSIHLPSGSTVAASGIEAPENAAVTGGVLTVAGETCIHAASPRGGTLDDGAALKVLLDQVVDSGRRETIILRSKHYYITTAIDLRAGVQRFVCAGPETFIESHFTGGGGNPTFAPFRYLTFESPGSTTTLLVAAGAQDTSIIVASLLAGEIACGAVLNIRPGDGSGAGVCATVVEPAPAAEAGGFRVYLSAQLRFPALISGDGTHVQVVTNSFAQLIFQGNWCEMSGTGTRFFSLSRNRRSLVENVRITPTYGVTSQIGSLDNLTCDSVMRNIVGTWDPDNTMIYPPIGTEGGERNLLEKFDLTGLDAAIDISGANTTVKSCIQRLNNTGLGIQISCGQGLDSVNNAIVDCVVTGGNYAYSFRGDGTGSGRANYSPRIENCSGIGQGTVGLDLNSGDGGTIVSPRVTKLDLRPRSNVTNFSAYNDENSIPGTLSDLQFDGIECFFPQTTLGAGNYCISSKFSSKFRNCRFVNCGSFGHLDGANMTIECDNVSFENNTSEAATTFFAYITAANVRMVFRDSSLKHLAGVGRGIVGTVGGTLPAIEAENSVFYCDAASHFEYIANLVQRFRNVQVTGQHFSGWGGRNAQELVLAGTGAGQAVAFRDAKAGDAVSVSHITDGGTPAAIVRTKLVPGTGATVYGAVGDTSTVQVSIGA